MRVLQITLGLPGDKNSSGAEKFCWELSQILKYRSQIFLATPSLIQVEIKTYHLMCVARKLLRKLFFDYFNPLNIFYANQILKKTNPDLIHFHSLYGLSTQLVHYISLRKPTIITAHDYWPFCYWSTLTKKGVPCDFCSGHPKFNFSNLLHFLHTHVNHYFLSHCTVVAPSTYMAHVLKTIGKFKNVVTIPNGVEPTTNMTMYGREILWVGRLTKEKGFDLVGPTLDKIAMAGVWKVNVLGEGVQKDAFIQKYPHIKFLGHQNPQDFYKTASILVVSSTWPENLPYVILEAMNYGLAIISTNVGGIPDMVSEGINGLFYINQIDFEKKMHILCSKPTFVRALGSEGKAIVKNKFDIKMTAKNYLQLYEDLLRKDRR